jgi:hypothetical protein
LEERARNALLRRNIASAAEAAWACGWLAACGYPGPELLAEALGDPPAGLDLQRDALGLDLHNVSCVFLAPRVVAEVSANGRAFLRNVRHGLYLLPFAVEASMGIGCPVDLAFALGGERAKNPYGEKLELAAAQGIEVADAAWQALA